MEFQDIEYTNFIERFDKIVLVSFGTIFVLSDEQMDFLIEAIKLTDSETTGFIISLKEYATSYEKVSQMNLPNIMLRSRIPQR